MPDITSNSKDKNTNPEKDEITNISVSDLEEEKKNQKSEEPAKIITSSGHHHSHHSHDGEKSKKHHRHHSSKKKKTVKKVLLVTGIFLLLVALIGASALFVLYNSGKREMISQNVSIETPEKVESVDNGRYVYYNGQKYKYKESMLNMLFLGIDENNGAETDGIGANGQADVIALMAIDSAASTVNIINIPRDIMTDIKVYSPTGGYSGTEKMQIALSFAYGDGADTSCVNTISAVRSLFYNIPVNSYFALRMEGVPAVNDSIGGVDVRSPGTIGIFTKGEKYHLEGADALVFVRIREMDSADANIRRNARQRVYLNSFINKLVAQTKSNISVPINIFNASAPYSITNLNPNRVTYLATEFILNKNMKINMQSVPVTVKQNGNRAENYVKEEEFYEKFLDIFYEKVSK